MGWTGCHSMRGHQTPKSYLDEMLSEGGSESDRRVLRSTIVGRTYYAAVERKMKADGHTYVFAAIVLFNHRPAARDGEVFRYKDMDESCGPYEAECPKAILKLLSPTEHKYSLEWRQTCIKNIEARTRRKKLLPGMRIRLADPLRLKSGETIYDFTIRTISHRQRQRTVYEAPNGLLYSLRGIQNREFTVTETPKNPCEGA